MRCGLVNSIFREQKRMQSTAVINSNQKNSSLFDQIYEIAKNVKNDKDAFQKISQIIKIDFRLIDVRDGSGMYTPASKLAIEGNTEAVELLMKLGAYVGQIALDVAAMGNRECAETLRINYGASPSYIAMGAAFNKNREYAEDLRINHRANVNAIAAGAAQVGDRDYAEILRINHGACVSSIASGAARGGNRDYAEYLLQQHKANVNYVVMDAARGNDRGYAEDLYLKHDACIGLIAEGLQRSRDFDNATIALRTLAFMKNNNYRAKIASVLKDKKLVSYDVTKLVPKAKKIAELLPKYNYSQCIALGNREIQTWYLQCTVIIQQKKLAPQLFLTIATYLSPLTLNEASDLYKKSRFDLFQKLLVRDIDKYCVATRSLRFFNRDKKAEAFSAVCSKAKNNEELLALLKKERSRKEDTPYQNLIGRHVKRWG
jgi:hypothetical protein